MVASGTDAHSGGTYAGTSAVEVGEAGRVAVCEAVGGEVGVAVGGKTICVTKLHANRDRIKNPNTIRLIFIHYL
jgi:hypothetical protein